MCEDGEVANNFSQDNPLISSEWGYDPLRVASATATASVSFDHAMLHRLSIGHSET